jgi:hypothetical protein
MVTTLVSTGTSMTSLLCTCHSAYISPLAMILTNAQDITLTQRVIATPLQSSSIGTHGLVSCRPNADTFMKALSYLPSMQMYPPLWPLTGLVGKQKLPLHSVDACKQINLLWLVNHPDATLEVKNSFNLSRSTFNPNRPTTIGAEETPIVARLVADEDYGTVSSWQSQESQVCTKTGAAL